MVCHIQNERKFSATRSVKKPPIYLKSLIIDKLINRQMLIQSAKVAKRKKKLICEKGHVETDFLGINSCSTYKNLSKDTNYGAGCRRSYADFEKSNCEVLTALWA